MLTAMARMQPIAESRTTPTPAASSSTGAGRASSTPSQASRFRSALVGPRLKLPALGAGGRRFKSARPDHIRSTAAAPFALDSGPHLPLAAEHGITPLTAICLLSVIPDPSRPWEMEMSRIEHLESFLRAEVGEGKAPSTLRNHCMALRRLDLWLASRDGMTAATAQRLDLGDYLADLHELQPGGALNWHVAALKVYFRWLVEVGVRADNPAATLRFAPAIQRPVESLTEDEVRALVVFVARARALRFGTHRTAILLLFLIDTGARVGEALGLRLDDLSLPDGQAIIRARKTHSVRAAPISPALRRHLVSYLRRRIEHLRARGAADCGLVFCCEHGGSWSVGGAERGCRTVARLAGIRRGVHPHLLRHTFAVLSLVNGAPLPAVMALGGWRRLSTVQRYTAMSARQLAGIQAASSPLAHAGRAAFSVRMGAD